MAQRGIPDRKAMFVKVYPEYESSARQTQHDHRGFDIVTGYDPGHQGVADPLPSPTPLVTSSRSVNRRDYKPTALRWWFHLLLIVCLGAFIGMTEYAIRNLANYHDDAIAKILASRGGVDDMFAKVAAVVVDSHSHPELARADGAQNSSGPTDQPVTPTATSAPAGESTTVDGGAGLATATTIDPPVTSTTDNGAGVQTKTTIDGGAGVVTTSTTTRVGTIPDPNAGLQDKTTTTTEPPALTTTDSGAGVETLTTTDDKAGVGTGTTVTPAMSTDGGLRTVTTLYPSTTDGEAGLVTETTPDGSAGLKTQTTAADGGRTTTSVTVIQQTTTLPSSEVTIERTTTAADGRPTIETVRTTVPGQTSVVQQSITVAPGEVLTTMTTVYAVTLGGTTETHATTWTDSDGSQHSSSYTTVVGGTTSSTTLSSVVATAAAPTGGSGGTRAGVEVLSLSETEYLAGAFLATILAVLVAFPLNLISINAKLMQPFHVLATSSAVRGATAEASVFLRFYSWSGALSLPRALRRGQPVIVLSDLLVGLAALLSPVAATTMSIHVGDGCQSHCFGRLGVSVAPARALQALMAAMVLLLALLLLTVSVLGWRTGVGQNPWGIAGMAGLCRDAELRERLQRIPRGLGGGPVDEDRVLKVLGERRYALGRSWEPHESSSSPAVYGVMVAGAGEAGSQLLRPNDSSGQYQEAEPPGSKFKKCQPFAVLTWWGRGGLFVLFSSVLIIVTYYGNTGIDSGFERFMDSQSLGVKFLFTALGVALGFSMNNFFRSVAILSPYLQLSKRPLPAERSILLSPPTNAISGIYSALRQRNLFLGCLAVATLLAELCLPVTLSHVPFSRLDKLSTERFCIWASIAILCLMLLVLCASLAIDWPHLPLDPRTIAGAMFYVCDSRMLAAFEGIGPGAAGKRERDRDVRCLRSRYGYGIVHGVSGGERMGVDVCDDRGEAADMVREKRISTRSSNF